MQPVSLCARLIYTWQLVITGRNGERIHLVSGSPTPLLGYRLNLIDNFPRKQGNHWTDRWFQQVMESATPTPNSLVIGDFGRFRQLLHRTQVDYERFLATNAQASGKC